MKFVFCTLLAYLILFSCRKNDSVGFVSVSDSTNDLVINPSLPHGDGRQALFFNTDEHLYRAFPTSKYIERIDIDSGKLDSLEVPHSGPYKINRLNGFCIDENRYFLFGNGNILTFDNDGQVINAKNYSTGKDELMLSYFLRVNHEFSPQIWKDKIIVHLEKSDSDKSSFPYHYDGYAFGSIDTETLEIVPLDIKWPSAEQYYGSSHNVKFSIADNKLIYNVSYSPSVYTYDFSTGESMEYEIMPYQGRENSAFTGSNDPGDLIQHLHLSTLYSSLNKSADKYFQVVYAPPMASDERYGKGHLLHIRVFDSSLKLVAEGQLPKGTLPQWMKFNKDYFLRFYSENEDELRYKKIEPML